MVIYTRKGDGGETSMFDSSGAQRRRMSKDSLKVESLGAIDELNSFFGIAGSFSENPETLETIKNIQKNLLTIGSIIAGSGLKFSGSKTKRLEKIIDQLEGNLPPLRNFVVPTGSKLAVHLQFARTLARRAERRVVALSQVEKIKPEILKYLNRLSDFIFMLARDANFKAGIKEEVWVGKRR